MTTDATDISYADTVYYGGDEIGRAHRVQLDSSAVPFLSQPASRPGAI
ncbi:hypothetical protein [Nocardia gamkensis]